jgi:hypothetical protein
MVTSTLFFGHQVAKFDHPIKKKGWDCLSISIELSTHIGMYVHNALYKVQPLMVKTEFGHVHMQIVHQKDQQKKNDYFYYWLTITIGLCETERCRCEIVSHFILSNFTFGDEDTINMVYAQPNWLGMLEIVFMVSLESFQ